MALNNGWIRIDTTSGSGNAAVAAVVLEKNTGRTVARSETIVGTNTHGVTATATIKQDPMGPFIVIDHIEKEGTMVSELDLNRGYYVIVGYSNVDFMTITETSDNYTDLNNVEQGEAWTEGFDITEHGTTHQHIQLESNIQYGTDEQYTFHIPFNVEDNEKISRIVSLYIENEDGDAYATFSIVQKGVHD